MKLRHPGLIRLAALAGAGFARSWIHTQAVRYQIDDERVNPFSRQCTGHYLYSFWHESLLFIAGLPFEIKAHVLISRHADGELIAQVCRWLGVGTVRGSTARGGERAIWELLEVARKGHIGITPDGPRGPRREVQPGIIYVASRSGLPIVPVGVGYSNAWRLKSWDRFALPKPGSTICAFAGRPFTVPVDANREEQEEFRLELQRRMDSVTARAETWARKY